MENNMENTDVCNAFAQAIADGKLKIYPKEASKGHSSEFALILSSLRTDPCTYLKLKQTTQILLAKNVTDPDDNKLWDLYQLNCPGGLPCHLIIDVFTEQAVNFQKLADQ
jgi:hypothetical protein